jgi:hypothetical protein
MVTLYVPLDVNYFEDDKIIRAGPLAELLYVRSLAFAKRNGSDGRITLEQLRYITDGIPNRHRYVTRLTQVGLWEVNGDGWYIAAWLKRNPKAAEVHQVRSRAGLAGNHRRWHVGPDGVPSHTCELCRDERMA